MLDVPFEFLWFQIKTKTQVYATGIAPPTSVVQDGQSHTVVDDRSDVYTPERTRVAENDGGG